MSEDQELAEKDEAEKERLATLQEAMSTPATYANLVNVAVSSQGSVRLSFAERVGDGPNHFRIAVVLPVDTAWGVADIIKKKIEENPNIQIEIVGEKPKDGD